MTQYYKIENNYPVISPILLEGFTEYEVGEEPQELIDAIKEQEAKELEVQQAIENAKARDEAMLKGFEYNGMDISVTKDDGDGIVQVKASFELGLTSTVIHFANGTTLPMTAEEFPAFALQFVTERGKFFQ